MMVRFLLCIVACALATVSGVAQRPCPGSWAQRGQSCYQLFDKHMHFHDGPAHYLSERFCNDIGAYLAEITSEEENEFFKAWLDRKTNSNETEGVWIGGKIPHGDSDWMWSFSRDSLGYTDWADHQGSQSGHCLSMSPKFNNSWVPEQCSKTRKMKYICEQYVCQLAGRCFEGSCYSLHCGTYRAWTSKRDVYNRDIQSISPCPDGQYLAQIETQEESDFIKSFLDDADAVVSSVWVGGYEDNIDHWKWRHSGETISGFTDWVTPTDSDDEDFFFDDICIGLSRGDGWAWRKYECGTLLPVLCERLQS